MTRNMTKGIPMKLILGFSIPLFFGFLFQQFYSLVDTLIVGRFLGKENLAAVGATGSTTFAILAGVFEMIARGLAGFLLVPLLGFTGVALGSPIAWLFADAFLIPAYFHVRKRCLLQLGDASLAEEPEEKAVSTHKTKKMSKKRFA